MKPLTLIDFLNLDLNPVPPDQRWDGNSSTWWNGPQIQDGVDLKNDTLTLTASGI